MGAALPPMAAVIELPNAMTPAQRILASFNRDQLAGFIEVAIGLLDLADDDPDAEDDDPPGGAIDDVGEGEPVMSILPLYGVDQDQDPINQREAVIQWHARDAGIVRTERGGWRRI